MTVQGQFSSVLHRTYELPHDKTKMACAPSEDSDQPGPCLIKVFTVRSVDS